MSQMPWTGEGPDPMADPQGWKDHYYPSSGNEHWGQASVGDGSGPKSYPPWRRGGLTSPPGGGWSNVDHSNRPPIMGPWGRGYGGPQSGYGMYGGSPFQKGGGQPGGRGFNEYWGSQVSLPYYSQDMMGRPGGGYANPPRFGGWSDGSRQGGGGQAGDLSGLLRYLAAM